MHEDDFPELRELQAMQKARHRKVIAGLLAGGVVSVAGGLAIFALSDGKTPQMGGGAVGVLLIGVGAVMIARALLSAFTRIDLRPPAEPREVPLPDEAEGDDA